MYHVLSIMKPKYKIFPSLKPYQGVFRGYLLKFMHTILSRIVPNLVCFSHPLFSSVVRVTLESVHDITFVTLVQSILVKGFLRLGVNSMQKRMSMDHLQYSDDNMCFFVCSFRHQ